MNAADPMTGGSKLPPVEAATSMPPASSGLYPSLFIMGIVMDPVATTSDVGLPDIVPNKAEDETAILAGPPIERPDNAAARPKKKSPPFAFSKKVPNITKRKA